MPLNLKAYIGARRFWAGKDADRHEACNVTVWHDKLIVGGGHLADLRIDVARTLVWLSEQTTADKVLIALSAAVQEAESGRKSIAAQGTGRARSNAAGDVKSPAVSPLLPVAQAVPPTDAPVARKRGTRILAPRRPLAPLAPLAP